MHTSDTVSNFIHSHYKESILKQIPLDYEPEETLITITIKLDLSKIFRSDKTMGVYIISHFPQFEKEVLSAVGQIFKDAGHVVSTHGIHLLVSISNCPLPMQHVHGIEFQSAAMQQQDGVMVYLKQVRVQSIGTPQIFLFSAEQVWKSRCQCSSISSQVVIFQQSLLEVVKSNAFLQNRAKSHINRKTQPPVCYSCEKAYALAQIQNEIYLNCQKITLLVPRMEGVQGIFHNPVFELYAQSATIKGLSPGALINCCAYVYCKAQITRAIIGAPVTVKMDYSSYLINCYQYETNVNQLMLRSENSQFFTKLSRYHIEQEYCGSLSAVDCIEQNYTKLLEGINKIRFAYLASEAYTTLKLSLLNSIFNHFSHHPLHVCVVAEDLLMIYRSLKISELSTKLWPSEYDPSTLISWLQSIAPSIVILVNPSKKDYQFLQRFFEGKLVQEKIITIWVITDKNPKKDFKIDYFGVVLDYTSEKNAMICRDTLEEMLDNKLSAFLTEDSPEEMLLTTISRVRNPNSRMYMIPEEVPTRRPTIEEMEEQDAVSSEILQKYYLKSRDLKKTTVSTFNYLYILARGFAALRLYMQGEDWYSRKPGEEFRIRLTILDCILAIFIDEETARHKFSNCNTVFGTEISKLILNENACEISFWGYEETEEGTLRESKQYLPKQQMFKRMLHRLNSLIYEDDLAYCDRLLSQ